MLRAVRKAVKRVAIAGRTLRAGVRVGKGCEIGIGARFEGLNVLGNGVRFDGSLGRGSYIGAGSTIRASIGRYCSIAGLVRTVHGRHPVSRYVSTHPAFFSTAKQAGFTFVDQTTFDEAGPGIVIGNDVWIGEAAAILDGVTIADGVVVAAGALVTKSLDPYGIYAGIPARKIGARFTDDQIKALLQLRWWENSPAWMLANARDFQDIDSLLARVRQNK